MFIRRTDGPVLSRQLYGVRPDVDVKEFRREKCACFQTMIIRLEEETFVHSCTRALYYSGDIQGTHFSPCNRGKRRKTMFTSILNNFETKKNLKYLHDSVKM